MTYLDASRLKAQIANHLNVSTNQIKNVIIWGNHSETQYPDALTDGYYIDNNGTKQSLKSIFANDMEYTNNTLVHIVQNRGKAVIDPHYQLPWPQPTVKNLVSYWDKG